MAISPPRPDLAPEPVFEPQRPASATTAFGLAAALAWIVSAYVSYRGIGWFPPPRALGVLAAGTFVVLAAGLLVGRIPSAGNRAIVGIAVVVLAVVLPPTLVERVPGLGHPTEHPLPGRPTVALTAAPEGNFELWLMRGDAEHLTRLTRTAAAEMGCDLSPDGTQVVFATDTSGTWDLAVMTLTADGAPGPIRSLSAREDADEVGATWSPDGERIAFTVYAGDHSEIWLVNADGTDARRIISEPAGAAYPSWSPDGTQIAFDAVRDDDPGDRDIWIANADGSEARDVIDVADDEWFPRWSPDGSALLFTADATGDQDAWLCMLPCDEPRNLTSEPQAKDQAVGWTPDGHPIVASDRLHYGGTFVYFVDDDGRMQLSLII